MGFSWKRGVAVGVLILLAAAPVMGASATSQAASSGGGTAGQSLLTEWVFPIFDYLAR